MVLWKQNDQPKTRWQRYVAFRMPGAPGSASTLNFLCVHALHSIADGQSYEPIVGDLLSLYAALGSKSGISPAKGFGGDDLHAQLALPILGNGLAELEKRLHSSLNAMSSAASPQQCSLRGNLSDCRFRGKGYGHLVGLQRGAVFALKRAAMQFGAPLDALLLALSGAAIMRAGGQDVVDLTLYTPMRDGPGESGLVGLLADWRDLAIHADIATGTVLGVVLETARAVRMRDWAVFNALRKPEAIMVNFQLLDAAPPGSRAGFVQLGEELWRIDENMNTETRSDQLGWVPQKLSITIEQQDDEVWWLLMKCGLETHPPPWMRRFVKSFEDIFWALLTEPMQSVHREFPEDFY